MMNIGIIGCGKLGICYSYCFASANYKLYCYDINIQTLSNIKNSNFDFYEPGLKDMIDKYKDNITVCYDIKDVIYNCNVIFSFINTPSNKDGSFNHSFIDNFINEIISYGKSDFNKLIVINSTVTPEYCDKLLNKVKDYNYDICYNPSFIAQGTIIANIINPEFIIVGSNNNSYEIIRNIYDKIVKNSNVSYNNMKLYEAEVTKIINNCFSTMKTSFINLVGDLIKSKGYNPDTVLEALSNNSVFGKKNMKYGYGYGGPCWPRDNKAFYNYIQNNINDRYINFDICLMSDTNNKNHLMFQFNELKNIKEPIEFRYITYKDNSNILDESQKLELALLLSDNGNEVIIYERTNIIQQLKNKYQNKFTYIEI